ncbi:unnamed protein product [Trifolium pratense]|uniref:Uncharacterized protein n=1 Tax=Trifolium pratense TaxID=57577 RepID=A0ACB0JMD8_TRIPR|nr:unnamed protein product [Trifolium pratense]
MTKALNNVWFGHYRVRASVAIFDRHYTGEEKYSQKKKVDLLKGSFELSKKDGSKVPAKLVSSDGGRCAEGSGHPECVRVGEVLVKLGASKEQGVRKADQNIGELSKDSEKEIGGKILMRNYRTKSDDIKWVKNGLVGTVLNGEAIPLIQNRISDAGFGDLVIIPMGADKVFVRSSEGVDVLPIVKGAKEFFSLVFSNWVRWGEAVMPYRRGVWVRLYGIPLHAWNVDFFKLCVFDCGSFLRADSCSADSDRLDFARVLIATPDLEIIKKVVTVLVDGTQVEVGEACLDQSGAEKAGKPVINLSCEGETANEAERIVDSFSPVSDRAEPPAITQGECEDRDLRSSVAPSILDSHERFLIHKEAEGTGRSDRLLCRSKRVIFSSSGKAKKGDKLAARKQKVRQFDTRKRKGGGLLRHPLHNIKKVARLPSKDRGEVLKILKKHVRRRRGGDNINRSCSVSRRTSSVESSSSSSVNNEWQNWVAMQGSEQMVVDDVWGIGKAIGVKFKGDNVNMFRVLSRANKGKKELPGPHHEGGSSARYGVLELRALGVCRGSVAHEDSIMEY